MERHRLIVWIALADFFLSIGMTGFALLARTHRVTQELREKLDAATPSKERERAVAHYVAIDEKTKNLVVALDKALRSRGVDSRLDRERNAVILPDVALFDSGKAELLDPRALAPIALALKEIETHWQHGFVLVVQGHTDAWPIRMASDFKSNLDLARKRATAFEDELARYGIVAPRFQVVSQAIGEFEPRVDNCASDNADGAPRATCADIEDLLPADDLAANRRIELRFGVFTGNRS
jgi:flagellar motor protein MotB